MQAILVDTKVACLEVMGTRKNTACSLFFLAPVTSKRLLGSLHRWPQAFLIFLTAAVKCHIVMQNNSKEMYKKSVLHMQIFVVLRIKSRSVMSGYHGSKISGSQQSFLTGHLHCQRWKLSMGYRFVPECNHAQESHTCQRFCCFLSYLQDHGLLRSRNHGNQGNVM